MSVQTRLNYEMNRQLQSDSDLSLADYSLLTALTEAPGGRLQISDLAALIGWERSRASHQLRRLYERGLAQRTPSEDDGRATDATVTKAGREAIKASTPGHASLVRRMFATQYPTNSSNPSLRRWNTSRSASTFNSALPRTP